MPYQFFLNLPFGETMVEMHSFTENYASLYKFNGKELDAETGLYYYGARYYDPKISNWLSVDPLAEKYQGWNPYNYTMQNPINLIDPTGMSPEEGDPKRRNFVVIDGSKNHKNDKALETNKKAVQKLDDSVTVISAKSRKDMITQISSHLGEGEKMGDLSILSHGNYDDTGFYIGKDYINTKSKMESLGAELAKYSDSDTNIVITACHLGAGHNPESSKNMLQILSNSTKANVFASMTWGAATENRFNNSDLPYFFSDPTYTVFDRTPSSPVNYKDKELGETRVNSIRNLGNTLYLRPNSDSKVIKNVYFTRTGTIKY